MITSRNNFTLPGLKMIRLKELPEDKSSELLLAISERIGNRAPGLAKLCGNLPFALRTAASVLAEREDLSVIEYEQRLEDKKARLRLAEASLSLSYDLLSETRRNQWSVLSIFPDDFDREGAAAVLEEVCQYSTEALSDLVKWSLLDFSPSSNGRYKMHDLARLFAESHLGSDMRTRSLELHCKYYLEVLSEARDIYFKGNENVLHALDLFDRERENILAGQAWAESIVHSGKIVNSTKEDANSFLYLASHYPVDGTAILNLRLHPSHRIHWLQAGLEPARDLNDIFAEKMILSNMGRAYSDLGETEKAIEYFQQALTISRETGDRRGEGAGLEVKRPNHGHNLPRHQRLV